MDRLVFSPFLSSPLLEISITLLIGLSAFTLYRLRRAGLGRVAVAGLIILALLNPTLALRDTAPLKSIVALIVDRSGSQTLSTRTAQTDAVLDEVQKKLSALPSIDLRRIEVRDYNDEGTRLFDSLHDALADVPTERIGGAILITDGLVDDVPNKVAALGFQAPVHALITGYPKERDRRVELLNTPPFGLVGREQNLNIKVTDSVDTGPVPITIRHDGKVMATARVKPGDTLTLPLRIDHAGQNIVEIDAEDVADELTRSNNRVVAIIEGVRDRLNVLLVSGAPHQGERTWRNMLKSDSNVDLIHFTILRPPEKQDGTPVNELALIPFPTKELFETKIKDFDLIILDRFADIALLPPVYFANIVRYVRKGGAILIAAGPEFAGPESPAETPLRDLLPAFPTGDIIETPFLPRLTQEGQKHPVTRDLAGGASEPPQWGEWIRQIATGTVSGTSVMRGANDLPLLILRRDGEGRVALLLSDHAWLWARQFRDGGPHLDLLRRTGHWLMKEPALEEEALRAKAERGMLTIERQTMADRVDAVTLIAPSGTESRITLDASRPGLWRATIKPEELGLYKASNGALTAFASVGPANPREFQDVLSTTDRLAALAEMSRGSVRRVADQPKDAHVPTILTLSDATRYAGADFIALRDTKSETVLGIKLWPLLQGVWGVLLLVGALVALWVGEFGGFQKLRRP